MTNEGGRVVPGREQRSKFPLAFTGIGGVGLLGCIACCGLPLLSMLGIAVGSGAAAVTGVVEPIAAVLLGVGLVGVVAFAVVRYRRGAFGQTGSWCSPGSWCCLLARRPSVQVEATDATER